MYMPAFQAEELVKGVSDETEVSDLHGTLAGRSREAAMESWRSAALSRDVRAKRSLTQGRCWEIGQAFYRIHTAGVAGCSWVGRQSSLNRSSASCTNVTVRARAGISRPRGAA
jgi:hypothetical protein